MVGHPITGGPGRRYPRGEIEVEYGFTKHEVERWHSGCAGANMGFDLGESFSGGGSDGNFTAALGVPTLDGLGAVGHGLHSPEEHVLTRFLPQRAALLAALLATL